MKALTILQPWSTAIAVGLKQYETRSRRTNYRGSLAIHAGVLGDEDSFWGLIDAGIPLLDHINHSPWSAAGITVQDLPHGAVLAVADLTDCLLMDDALISSISPQERAMGHWEPGRYAYRLDNVRPLTVPVPARGYQGFWEWSPDVH